MLQRVEQKNYRIYKCCEDSCKFRLYIKIDKESSKIECFKSYSKQVYFSHNHENKFLLRKAFPAQLKFFIDKNYPKLKPLDIYLDFFENSQAYNVNKQHISMKQIYNYIYSSSRKFQKEFMLDYKSDLIAFCNQNCISNITNSSQPYVLDNFLITQPNFRFVLTSSDLLKNYQKHLKQLNLINCKESLVLYDTTF